MLYKRILVVMVLVMTATTFSYAELGNALSEGPFTLKYLPKYKRALAIDVAFLLNDRNCSSALAGKLTARSTTVDLVPFLESLSSRHNSARLSLLKINAAQLDRQIREVKGIADRVEHLLEIRLALPETKINHDQLLVAYVPGGNERSWKSIEAFDSKGNIHQLAVDKAPTQPVVVVGLNAKKDMRAGLSLLNEELRAAGMQIDTPNTAGLDVAKLNFIRLDDDKEPWISGDAEIYTLVNGIAPEASKANVLAVEMPYLDKDKKDYRPNQVLIVWKNYRYKAANLNIYEHDDSTNYKSIAEWLIGKIGQVVPEYGYIFEIASQIIKLMPDEWFTNDDDYVDVFYTLEKGKTYKDIRGASSNARITLVPYTIEGSK